MPKSSTPAVLALTEHWDHARTKDLAARAADLPPEVRAGLKAALKKMYGDGPTRRLKTEYSRAKSTPAFGRLYARGPSLQSVPGWMRRLVAGGEYHDIDMVNAAPTLLYGLGKRMDLDLPALERYVDEREEVNRDLCGEGEGGREGGREGLWNLDGSFQSDPRSWR